MASIKISSKVEQAEWRALQDLARESHQSISGLLTEVISDKGLFESALFRPQKGYYDDLAEMASVLFESLLINHATRCSGPDT